MEQNDEFSLYMESAKGLISSLAAATEKSRAYAWLRYLQESSNSKLRLDYIKLLVFSLHKNKLLGIFTDDPPVDIQIPPFPGGVTLATMKDYISALAAADRGSGDSNLRTTNRVKNGIPLNIIPEEAEIYCYMLHGGNERDSSRGKSCSCGSKGRRSPSPGRRTGQQQHTNREALAWISDLSGHGQYELGEQDPWYSYVYLEQINDPKGKTKVITHMDEDDAFFYQPNLADQSRQSEGVWQAAEDIIGQSYESVPFDGSHEQRSNSPFGGSGGGRFQSFPPRDFLQSSPQQTPRSPGRSPQTPRFSPQGGFGFSPPQSAVFSPQYMSTPTAGSSVRSHDWSDESSFRGSRRPPLNQPVRPKSRWAYSQLDNYAPAGYYPQSPGLSQTHPQVRRPILREQRDYLIRNMPDFRTDVMRGQNVYEDLYHYGTGCEEDPNLCTPPQMSPRLPEGFDTPRRHVNISPPRNMSFSPPGSLKSPISVPPVSSPEAVPWGTPRRSPSPGARRSPSPPRPRNWQQQMSYGDYTGSSADPRSFASTRSGASSAPQSSPDGGRRRRRPPVFIHQCECSCSHQPVQPINLDSSEQPSGPYLEDSPSSKMDSDDAGKGCHLPLDKGNAGSEHSVWEEEGHDNSVPSQISGGDVNVQQKSNCRCASKGEHYQGR